ncbi:MAG: type II secretion system F family protein [Acidimicrobiales bacterium]
MSGPGFVTVASAVALALWLVQHRPVPLPGRVHDLLAGRHRPDDRPSIDEQTPATAGGPALVVGRVVRRVAQRSPDAVADRRAGWATLGAVPLVAVAPPLAVLWVAGWVAAPVVRARRWRTRAGRDLVDELPDVVDLLALATASGLTVPLAVAVVAEHGQGRLAAELGRVGHQARLGTGLADALDEIPRRLGEPVRPVTRVLASSVRDGTSLVAALERVAADVRTERRRAAEERARKVSVRLLFPLVSCVLPAFALLTVVPLLAGALSGIDL